MATDVFISYSSKEASEAYMLKSVLEENGISCWMAPESIPAGSNYAEEIPDGIGGCTVFLLLLSDKSQKSRWVSLELDEALDLGKMIIPYAIEKCNLSKAFDFRLKACQRMDAYEENAKAVKTLVNRIKSIIAAEADENAAVAVQDDFYEAAPAVKGRVERVEFADGSVYVGELKDGKCHGKGRIVWADGGTYEGGFANNQLSGRGKQTWADGTTCEGEYVEGACHGKGRMTWADGSVYEGSFVKGKRTGIAIQTWADGSIYIGEYWDGELHGKGKYKWPDGSVYEGDYVYGERTGTGKQTWDDGSVYTGDFLKGRLHGRGRIVWASGNYFEGEFADGNMYNGYGYNKNGYIIFKYVNGKQC